MHVCKRNISLDLCGDSVIFLTEISQDKYIHRQPQRTHHSVTAALQWSLSGPPSLVIYSVTEVGGSGGVSLISKLKVNK